MSKIQIFKDYDEFLNRSDKSVNGVTQEFLDENNLKLKNVQLENCIGCYNCRNCKDCKDCIDCINCKDCRICIDCIDCRICINCKNCIDCRICIDCIDCIFCINCIDCRICIDCMNCKICINCKKCNHQFKQKGLTFNKENIEEQIKIPICQIEFSEKEIEKIKYLIKEYNSYYEYNEEFNNDVENHDLDAIYNQKDIGAEIIGILETKLKGDFKNEN